MGLLDVVDARPEGDRQSFDPIGRERPVDHREAGLAALTRELGGAASAGEMQLNAFDRDALPVSRLVALEREASGRHPAAQQLHQRAAARQGHRADVAIDHRDGRGALGRALVEALPRLAPEAAAIDQRLLHQRGLIALVAEVGLEDRLRDQVVGVVADQVHQLARPHAEAGAAQRAIELGRTAGLLLQQLQRLGVVRARDAVDDEAGRRLRMHRRLAPAA